MSRNLTLLAVTAAALFTPVARGSVMTFITPTGSSVGDGPVNATATFTTGSNSLTITLRDLEVNPTSVGQTVNGVNFMLSNNLTAGSLTSEKGMQRTVTGNGAGQYTNTGTASSFITGSLLWNYYAGQNSNGSPTPHIIELSGLGNMAAKPTVIGDPNVSNAYSNANGSILSGTHDPFLAGTVTFVLNVPGVTSNTTIQAVTFQFGTGEGEGEARGVPLVPEPSTIALAVAGLSATGLTRLFKLRRRR